jgi:hypothetical protein
MSIAQNLNLYSANSPSDLVQHKNIANVDSSIIDTEDKLSKLFNSFYLIEFSKNQNPPLLRIYENEEWYKVGRDSFPFNLPFPINDIKFNFVGSIAYKENEKNVKLSAYQVDRKLLKLKTIEKILSLDVKNKISH